MVYEFLDNDQFSNLDTLMLQLAPGECFTSLDADAAKGKPRGDMAKVLYESIGIRTTCVIPGRVYFF